MVKNTGQLLLAIALYLKANSVCWAVNVGQDFTRPLGRADLRWTYQNRRAKQEYDDITLRVEQPFAMSSHWTLNTRVDLSGVYKNLPAQNQEKWGLGDIDVQTAMIRKLNDRFSTGGGIRAIFPTASASRFGTGKYRLLLGGGLRAMLPEINAGSFIAPQVQYDFDIGGDGSRLGISQIRILPTFNLGLPRGQFVSFLSSGDIRYNFLSKKWFVPFDITYGKRWRNLITSIEVSYPIIDDLDLYEVKTTLRFGFFF